MRTQITVGSLPRNRTGRRYQLPWIYGRSSLCVYTYSMHNRRKGVYVIHVHPISVYPGWCYYLLVVITPQGMQVFWTIRTWYYYFCKHGYTPVLKNGKCIRYMYMEMFTGFYCFVRMCGVSYILRKGVAHIVFDSQVVTRILCQSYIRTTRTVSSTQVRIVVLLCTTYT